MTRDHHVTGIIRGWRWGGLKINGLPMDIKMKHSNIVKPWFIFGRINKIVKDIIIIYYS